MCDTTACWLFGSITEKVATARRARVLRTRTSNVCNAVRLPQVHTLFTVGALDVYIYIHLHVGWSSSVGIEVGVFF